MTLLIAGIGNSREHALQEMQTGIMPWLMGNNPDHLLYDLTYGGVVPQRGLLDVQADYGSGLYSDHHFHYGYFIYAGAVLAKLSPAFFAPYQLFFDTLTRDICNPSHQDELFPFARHKDMFDGHSWASGLFQQANGKNQESSSEAVNAYYAVTLYAQVTEQNDLYDFARVMLSTEIQAVQSYWHVADSSVYDKTFGMALGMVGNIGAFDTTTSTWFGRKIEYIYGINIMPVTPVMAAVFSDTAFLQTNFARVEELLGPYVPGSDAPSVSPTAAVTRALGAEKCSANRGCAVLGMQGECCPTLEGTMLACCDGTVSTGGGHGHGVNGDGATSSRGGGEGDGMSGEWQAVMFALYGSKKSFFSLLDCDQETRDVVSCCHAHAADICHVLSFCIVAGSMTCVHVLLKQYYPDCVVHRSCLPCCCSDGPR